ncbi:hypothetical protein DL770_010870 [Monosporascus sp. CRB-9-2]|nr:hypothetical protein DL770_010870 [Monosporascus sp. CRB-9-2]
MASDSFLLSLSKKLSLSSIILKEQDSPEFKTSMERWSNLDCHSYYIGGGISIYTPFTGYGSEYIISAKLINSKSELMDVSESRNPEVLWGLRGADQFLGLVTEQVDAVCAALEVAMSNKSYVSAGHFMILQTPPDLKQQVLLVAPQTSGRFSQAGLAGCSTEKFKRLVELHAEPVQKCPDTARSGYTVEWHSRCTAKRELQSSFGHENVEYWLVMCSGGTPDSANHDFFAMMDWKAQVAMRVNTEQDDFVSYLNTTRDDPLEYRYKGTDRISKLKALKNQLDPIVQHLRVLDETHDV